LKKEPKTYTGEKTVISTNSAGETGYLYTEDRNYLSVHRKLTLNGPKISM
jgi:hypothetical protein